MGNCLPEKSMQEPKRKKEDHIRGIRSRQEIQHYRKHKKRQKEKERSTIYGGKSSETNP